MTDCGLKAARRWCDAALGRGPRRRIESIFGGTWQVEKELAEHIESSAGLMLQNIFHVHGEEHCRRLEREVLVELLAARSSAVLAAGGGIVTREDTYGLLRQHLRHILVEKLIRKITETAC
jgi:hypothetical protein